MDNLPVPVFSSVKANEHRRVAIDSKGGIFVVMIPLVSLTAYMQRPGQTTSFIQIASFM
jgi:hypothetical protein